MESIYQVLIDGNLVVSTKEFHELMKRELDFPEHYGMNPDALWDCLQDSLLADSHIDIFWKKFSKSVTVMGQSAEILRATLLEAKMEFPDNLRVLVED